MNPYPPQFARRERHSEFVGPGCLVQGLGIALPVGGFFGAGTFGGALGALVGLILLVIGGRMALKWRCGACKNPIASGAVQVCPACRWPLR